MLLICLTHSEVFELFVIVFVGLTLAALGLVNFGDDGVAHLLEFLVVVFKVVLVGVIV